METSYSGILYIKAYFSLLSIAVKLCVSYRKVFHFTFYDYLLMTITGDKKNLLQISQLFKDLIISFHSIFFYLQMTRMKNQRVISCL